MLNFRKTLYLFCFVLVQVAFFPKLAHAQLTAPGYDFARLTGYYFTPQDSIFVFLAPKVPVLKAVYPNCNDSCEFSWYKYNRTAKKFEAIAMHDSAVNSSTYNNVPVGCYKVYIEKDTLIDSLRAWVVIDSLSLELEKDTAGAVPRGNYFCRYLDLKYTLETPDYTYTDVTVPATDSAWNKVTLTWTSDNMETLPTAYASRNYSRIYSPPAEDTYFYLHAVDQYGLEVVDTVFYKSIQTDAKMEKTLTGSKVASGLDETDTTSSPLTVVFRNRSINGNEYQWYFYDSLTTNPEPVIRLDTSAIDTVYYTPGKYTVKLISYSEENCVDSASLTITVANSTIDWPNVFTPNTFSPNDDGLNDYFKPYFNSIKKFHISIFSRWGVEVYKFDGDVNYWDGWDGRIKGSGFKAPVGVYYYVVSLEGYGKLMPPSSSSSSSSSSSTTTSSSDYQLKGFVYLFR
jgi:gliding motility-associated-like protein